MKATRLPRNFRMTIPAAAAIWAAVLTGLLAGGAPRAQTMTNTARLEELSRRFADELESRRTALYHDLLESDVPWVRSFMENPDVELMYIDDNGHPVFYGTNNMNAAATISTNKVWPGGAGGFSLSGTGTAQGELGVWDAGAVLTNHQELSTRASWADTDAYATHWHATHVAGTMIASGVVGTAKGMSYQGTVDSYNWTNDAGEMANAAAAGMNVSNHSYGFLVGWGWYNNNWYWFGDPSIDSNEDYKFGYYDAAAQQWDQIAYNAPFYTIAKSSGNDRGEGPTPGTGHYHWSDGLWYTDTHQLDGGSSGYDCVTPKGVAKNVLTVGAVADIYAGYNQPSDVIIESYSSIGPADDGRIKPDLVANGQHLYSCTDASISSYTSTSGTSMATPNAAGSLNLLVRHFEATHSGATPRSATMKAVLVHTADEAGSNPGPDYVFGWGLMNTLTAAQVVQADANYPGHIVESVLNDTATDEYFLHLIDSRDLTVTMAWTDPAGTPPSPSLDPSTAMLVNDLDVRLEHVDTGAVYSPWILNPSSPSSAATTGDNTRDNVEQVLIADAPSGSYKVSVSHKGSLSGGSQAYSLVASAGNPGVTGAMAYLGPCYQAWSDATTSPLGGQYFDIDAEGVAIGDYDGDGDDDIYVAYANGANQLLRNDGAMSFTDVSAAPLNDSGTSRGAAWADYDNDGDPDLYLTNDGSANKLFRNDGGGSFTALTGGPLGDTGGGFGVAWADYDNDGDLDLYFANSGSANKLLRNDGGGTFTDATSGPLGDTGAGRGVAWTDYDNDGDPDIYLVNSGSANKLFRNDGGGTFTDVTSSPLDDAGNGTGVDWGDYDNDGDLDAYLCNENGANKLFRNDGGGSFSDVTASPLDVWGTAQSCAWLDYDRDGDVDIYMVNGSSGSNLLFRNDGGGSFTDVTANPLYDSQTGTGLGVSDYDGDGDPDLYVGNSDFSTDTNRLFRNDACGANHWLALSLRGTVSNASAIGARVRVVSGSGLQSGIGQVREVSGGSGYLSDNSLVVAFGLGESTQADSVTISWPSGIVQTITGVAADQVIDVEESPFEDLADHNVGNVVLSMTDQGILGFLDDSQEDGSGFIFPSDGSNQLYIGGLWVSQCENYVANRDYSDDPEQEWVVSDAPDGHVRVDTNGTSDQDIHAAYTDDGSEDPFSFYIRQESWAWADDPNDDFVIVRYFIHNRADSTQDDMYAGVFMDFDLEDSSTDDTGGSDVTRQLVYIADDSGLHTGVRLLGGDDSPDSRGNMTLVHNPTYVWPDLYIPDEDKLAFLRGSDAEHIVPEATDPDDYSLLISAGPFELAPGDSNEVVFAIIGGSSLSDLQANADRAQVKYLEAKLGAADAPGPAADAGVTKLLPNAPNPFNPVTTVRFRLGSPGRVRLAVYDARGRRVRVLADGARQAGMHSLLWDGRDDGGRPAASGVYFLKLDSAERSDSRRITMVK